MVAISMPQTRDKLPEEVVDFSITNVHYLMCSEAVKQLRGKVTSRDARPNAHCPENHRIPVDVKIFRK